MRYLNWGWKPIAATWREMKRMDVPSVLLDLLAAQRNDHQDLREERNSRVHRAYERAHSSCDRTFKIASIFERNGRPLKGADSNGKRINLDRYMKEALVELQRDHNNSVRLLSRRLVEVYDCLHAEFNLRFGARFNDPGTGFGHKKRNGESKG